MLNSCYKLVKSQPKDVLKVYGYTKEGVMPTYLRYAMEVVTSCIIHGGIVRNLVK